MSKRSDQAYLLSDQYKDASNVTDRFQLHERFSTNTYGWHRWVFDQLRISPQSRILELGCGPAFLWTKNSDRIPEEWDILLSDFSPGMLEEAKSNVSTSRRKWKFEVIDAQSIPCDDGAFDVVIANHMLYHVPDRKKALSEIHRVVKPGGVFYAAANGKDHHREMAELVEKAHPGAYREKDGDEAGFSLENGGSEISEWFSRVTLHRYEDALEITKAEPLIAYVRSGGNILKDKLVEFRRIVEAKLASDGMIRITKAPGIFEAWKTG